MRSYVILLNWNGWKDTIECLESVLRLNFPDFRVVVCDNGSTDGSLEKIKAWASGNASAGSTNTHIDRFTKPPVAKPVPYLHRTRSQAESATESHGSQLVLIETGANLGFAGGNNVGVRYALADPKCEFLWLLNNDTVVAPDALSQLVAKASTDPRIGAVASICYYADSPATVQVWAGARVNLWLGIAKNMTRPHPDEWFDALYGASFLVSRAAFEDAGLLDQGFFLGWEETEFCVRLRKLGWRLAAAPDSHVWHKVNSSSGGNRLVLDRYFTASGLRILRLQSPAPYLAMPIFVAIRLGWRLARLRLAHMKSVWAGVQDYLRTVPIKPKTQIVSPNPKL